MHHFFLHSNCREPHICVPAGGEDYKCMCPGGFFPDAEDATKCIDVDECTMGMHTCGASEECENSVGGFGCVCPEGQELGLSAFFQKRYIELPILEVVLIGALGCPLLEILDSFCFDKFTNFGKLTNFGELANFGELTNFGKLTNFGELTNCGELT